MVRSSPRPEADRWGPMRSPVLAAAQLMSYQGRTILSRTTGSSFPPVSKTNSGSLPASKTGSNIALESIPLWPSSSQPPTRRARRRRQSMSVRWRRSWVAHPLGNLGRAPQGRPRQQRQSSSTLPPQRPLRRTRRRRPLPRHPLRRPRRPLAHRHQGRPAAEPRPYGPLPSGLRLPGLPPLDRPRPGHQTRGRRRPFRPAHNDHRP